MTSSPPSLVIAPAADPGDLAQPEWLRRMGEPGGVSWTIRCLDSGQEFGPFTEEITRAHIEELDGGRCYRYEVSQWRESPTGKTRFRQGRPRIVRLQRQDPAWSTSPGPQGGEQGILMMLGERFARLEGALSGQNARAHAPVNPWVTPTGEPAVPASTLEAMRGETERRVRSAEEQANLRVENLLRQHRDELSARDRLNESLVASERRTIGELEARLRRQESEGERTRVAMERYADEREELHRQLRDAEEEVRGLRYDLDDARRLAAIPPPAPLPAPGAAVPGSPLASAFEQAVAFKNQIDAAAKAYGWAPPTGAAAAEPAEPLEVKRLRTYGELASTGKDMLIDLINAWRTSGPPQPGAPPQPQQPQQRALPPGGLPPSAAANPDGAGQLVAFIEGSYKAGRSPTDTYATAAPFVPADILAAFRAMPTAVFVANVYGVASEASPLRSMQARGWLAALHQTLQRSLPAQAAIPPPATPQMPLFPPLAPSPPAPAATAAAPAPGPSAAVLDPAAALREASTGVRFQDWLREHQAAQAARGTPPQEGVTDDAPARDGDPASAVG